MSIPIQSILMPPGLETEIRARDDLLHITQWKNGETQTLILNADQALKLAQLLLPWADSQASRSVWRLTEKP